jgi:hypothetical protein
MLILCVTLELINLNEAGSSRHELEDAVHAKHRSKVALDSSSFESTPDLNSSLLEFDRVGGIEESRSLSDLLQVSLSESLLDDDVEKSVHHGLAFSVVGVVSEVDLDFGSLFNMNRLGLTLEDALEMHRSVNCSESIETLS